MTAAGDGNRLVVTAAGDGNRLVVTAAGDVMIAAGSVKLIREGRRSKRLTRGDVGSSRRAGGRPRRPRQLRNSLPPGEVTCPSRRAIPCV